jgi:hypothetical protein
MYGYRMFHNYENWLNIIFLFLSISYCLYRVVEGKIEIWKGICLFRLISSMLG